MRKENKLYGFGIIILLYILGITTSYAQCPTISSFTPASGPVNTVVTVTGNNFESGSGITSVQINGVNVTDFTIISDTEAEVTVPANASTGAVTLASSACSGVSGTPFTLLSTDCTPTVIPTDLYISELYDHNPGSYGVIELYNPTNSTINFTGQYVLERYGTIGDGSPTAGYTLALTGSVGPLSAYLVTSWGAGVEGCTITASGNLGQGINDSDEIKLRKNGPVIDIARAPGYTWYSVIRKPDATAPSAAYIAGDWTTSAQNAQSCSNLGSHTTNVAPASSITTQPQDEDSACENGQAQFAVALSNTTGFSYQWKMLNNAGVWVNVTNGPNYSGATTATLTIDPVLFGLNETQYYCQITSPGCTLVTNAAQLIVLPQPVVTLAITQPTCTLPTGSITITPIVGEGLTYKINNGPFQTSTTFDGLDPGDYILTIQSSAECLPTTMDVTIDPVPSAPAIATVTIVQPTCAAPSGTITVTAPTGAGLTYSIDGTTYQTGTTFPPVVPGTYTITVKNAAGCTSVTGNIIINAAPNAPAVATITTVQPTCALTTGNITITAPTEAGMSYSLDGTTFQTSTTFSPLSSGTYTITVKNAAGCTSVTGTIVINPVPNAPDVATVTTIQPTCFTPTGTITVTTPTEAGMSYSIDGTTFQTGTTFTPVAPGTYTISVKNAAGCTSVTGSIIIDPAPDAPAVATVTTNQPTCAMPTGTITITAPTEAGMSYSIDGTTFQTGTTFTPVAPGAYTITVKNAAGCSSVTGSIIIDPAPNAPDVATVTTIQPTCAMPTGNITITAPTEAGMSYSLDGTTFQTGTTFSPLAPGTYTITVKNVAGCTSVTGTIVIDPAPNAPDVATVTTVQPTCATPTGTITITAPTEAGMSYSLDGTTFQTSTTFAPLAPGTYSITVKNADGCTSVSPSIAISAAPGAPQISGVQGCRETSFGTNYVLEGLPLDNSFDIATANFEWRNEAGNIVGDNENTFNVSQYADDNSIDIDEFPLQFTLTVTTAAGCENTFVFTVAASFCNIPRGISPNNDTLNDNFDLTGLDAKKIAIFNRYGQEVYVRNDYKDEWCGQANNGDELPTGTYYYVIETAADSYTGWVYVNRQEN